MAVDAAGVIHILRRHAHDRDEVGAVAGLRAGQRFGDAELERLLPLGAGTAGECAGQPQASGALQERSARDDA
jgi:hypothetical protein